MQKRGNKGISNMLAVVIIILVSIIIIIAYFINVKDYLEKSSSIIWENVSLVSNFSLKIIEAEIVSGNLQISVENTGEFEIIKFTVRVEGTDGEYVNNTAYFENIGTFVRKIKIIIPAPTDIGKYKLIEVIPEFGYEKIGNSPITGAVINGITKKANVSAGGGGGGGGSSGGSSGNSNNQNEEVSVFDEDDILSRTGTCGDGTCNLRIENHFNCSQDCSGKYYVVDNHTAGCSDSGQGNLTKPFCNIGAVFDKVNPGDTIYIRDGLQYFGAGNDYLERGGTPGNYVTFRNYPGENPVIESGTEFNSNWTEEEGLSSDDYKVWSSVSVLGTDSSDYPYRIFRETDIGMSRFVDIENFTSLKYFSGLNGKFDAVYINCSNGKVYIRFGNTNINPNNDTIYFSSVTRWYITASYVRLINLTMQHGNDGVKMNNPDNPTDPEYKRITQHVEVYDSTIRSTTMGIGDHAYNSSYNNYFIFDNNNFTNIGAKVEISRVTNLTNDTSGIGDSRNIKCIDELQNYTWMYNTPGYDHALYGDAVLSIFSNNYVDAGTAIGAVGISNGSIYFNNYILGDFYTRIDGSALLYNNIVYNKNNERVFRGYAGYGVKIYNNLFIGNGTGVYNYSVLFNPDSQSGTSLIFKNNIIADLNTLPSSVCMRYRLLSLTGADINNNIYAGCNGWHLLNNDINELVQMNISNFSSWKSYSNLDLNSIISNISATIQDISSGIYSPPAGSVAINNGTCVSDVEKDYNLVTRPQGGKCDIGAFES